MNVSALWWPKASRAIILTTLLLILMVPSLVLGQPAQSQPKDLAACLENLDMANQEAERRTRLHDQSEAEITRLEQEKLGSEADNKNAISAFDQVRNDLNRALLALADLVKE